MKAVQLGERPDGRMLAPVMPWRAYASLKTDVAVAIAAFLQSLNPVGNRIPGPFKSGETVSTFTFRIMPPGETAPWPRPSNAFNLTRGLNSGDG